MNKSKILALLHDADVVQRNSVLMKVWAFISRDFKIYWTYKFWVMFDIIDVAVLVGTYYFVAQIVTPTQLIANGYSTGDYFTFALLGIAFSQYVQNSVQGLTESVREEQWSGTIETVLSSGTNYKTFLFGASAFRFLYGTVILIGALTFGLLLGGKVVITPATIATTIIFGVLLVAGHLAIGAMSAGMVVMIKRGEPIAWGFTWMTQLVSGVFYPLGLLPWYMKWVGFVLPLTYSLDGIRRTLINGASLFNSQILQVDLIALLAFLLLMLPVSLKIFSLAFKRSQTQGTLGQY